MCVFCRYRDGIPALQSLSAAVHETNPASTTSKHTHSREQFQFYPQKKLEDFQRTLGDWGELCLSEQAYLQPSIDHATLPLESTSFRRGLELIKERLVERGLDRSTTPCPPGELSLGPVCYLQHEPQFLYFSQNGQITRDLLEISAGISPAPRYVASGVEGAERSKVKGVGASDVCIINVNSMDEKEIQTCLQYIESNELIHAVVLMGNNPNNQTQNRLTLTLYYYYYIYICMIVYSIPFVPTHIHIYFYFSSYPKSLFHCIF